MIASLANHPKRIAWCFAGLFYLDMILTPSKAKGETSTSLPVAPRPYNAWLSYIKNKDKSGQARTVFSDADQRIPAPNAVRYPVTLQAHAPAKPVQEFTTGPGQPEMAAFTSVNSANMVDLFTGDFSYNIPLLDVGGYPVNIAYRGGISMDQEASWVGLGWNINPGTITRNMRGLPDDFNGQNDSIKKVQHIKENKTIGGTIGADMELTGFPLNLGASVGIFHNTYRGWGFEQGINASINAGLGSHGTLTSGLSITNNSQEGLTVAPSFSVQVAGNENEQNSWSGSFSISAPYNSRAGLRGLQLSAGLRQYNVDKENQNRKAQNASAGFSSVIAFANPSFTPSITIPFTSRQFSFTAKLGGEKIVEHANFFLRGYVSRQYIDDADTLLSLPAYGYLNYQYGSRNRSALLDFNREKEIAYREKPAVPHIAVPVYTYDAFSITGEGTGGMFRAYRGDIGFVYDHALRTKDGSDNLSLDAGIGDLVHVGVDVGITRAFTQNGPWLRQNPISRIIDFRNDTAGFEAAYFRNPGEKSINSMNFYNAIGGDDVVTVGLAQGDISNSIIHTTNYLTRYRNKREAGNSPLTTANSVKQKRDKRTQVISYLTASEAEVVGLSRFIENYTYNEFNPAICGAVDLNSVGGPGTGIPGAYYNTKDLKGDVIYRTDPHIDSNWINSGPKFVGQPFPTDYFSIRWHGRVIAPQTGKYTFITTTDDGCNVWLNDSSVIRDWGRHPATDRSFTVNLVAGELYTLKMEYFEHDAKASVRLQWIRPGETDPATIPAAYLYELPKDTVQVNEFVSKEQRINTFRKPNHISEIDVLNTDGRRYVYGIPVYNLAQKEATFSVAGNTLGNINTGLVQYNHGTDNTATGNHFGKDNYFSSEETPAYAHSFLLTAILSSDYSDITGNGISDDDIGDAVKFNYTKVCGIANPFQWRAPYIQDSVTYNPGLRTDTSDDKGSYVSGEKELWYMHSIESKTMIATFTLESRDDLQAVNERGVRNTAHIAQRLKEINLYTKAEFMRHGTGARPVKTVHFEYGYDLCKGMYGAGNGKLTLKKIWFTYNKNDKGKLNPYVFSYSAQNPDFNNKSYDRWGNYKDPLQNPGSTAGNTITNSEYPYALQDSAAAAANAAAWSLDSIYLPSGGSIKVNYESDDYAYVQNKRAMQLFKIAGLGTSSTIPSNSRQLYQNDIAFTNNLYVYIKVPRPVATAQEVYRYYLTDIQKLFFKVYVKMPGGYEYVSCYADISPTGGYGRIDANTIWVKMSGISPKGDGPGDNSPVAKAATQFLRLNLPAQAYPGYETDDNLDPDQAIKITVAMIDNITHLFSSFDGDAHRNNRANTIDTSRSFVRLNNPYYKKYGGGQRVKRITIYDNWNKMTGQRAAMYGQEYTYTTVQELNGVKTAISSGVASYEPGLGGEENPFHLPIEYVEKISALGPVTLAYSEEPLGESFFPSAGIGYSDVRVRTINYKNKKSANGYEETTFYTAYDFPTYTDRTLLDNATKKRYKPALSNFLRVNAQYYIALSQGFKIELNDMHGKLRTKATYAETDSTTPVSYSENIYRVENRDLASKQLSNTVMVMKPDGSIDSAALIGKDVELMMDMREQVSITLGGNVSLNADIFLGPPPTTLPLITPSAYGLPQREENMYHSVATVKVIQRYGILDSAIQVDKGSKISTKDLLYDSETGDVLLTRTQNEYNDYVYNFTYPSHWAYDGMGLAYKNIDVTLNHVTIRDGKLVSGNRPADSLLFSSGDELLVGGKQKTGDSVACYDIPSTFPVLSKIWVIDSSVLNGGPKAFYFIDKDGKAYSGYDISLKIVRSGRRNILAGIGSVTTLDTPIRKNSSGNYELVLNDTSKMIAAGAAEFKQLWKVEDVRLQGTDTVCATVSNPDTANSCNCLKGLFDYLIASHRLFTTELQHKTVRMLIGDAQNAGYNVSGEDCSILLKNADKPFYALTTDSNSTLYKARVGDCYVSMKATNDTTVDFYQLQSSSCRPGGKIHYDYLVEDNPGEGCYSFKVNGTYQHGESWSFSYINCDGDTLEESGVYDDCELNDPQNCNGRGVVLPGMACARPGSIVLNNCDTVRIFHCPGGGSGGSGGSTFVNFSDYHLAGPNISTAIKSVGFITFYDILLTVDSCNMCTLIPTSSCYSIVTDTTLNPYRVGILGNWRSNRSYTYYGRRTENDPSTQTDIRRNGAFKDFTPFWNFQDSQLVMQPDTNRWVWNSEMTLFNRKGFEIENKDPLGRYNAGLYGYNLTLPTAVIQNSRNRESAFEGFEDYDFITSVCDTACSIPKHIDYSAYNLFIDTTQKHTGKSSLRVDAGEEIALQFSLTDSTTDATTPAVSVAFTADACSPDGKVLDAAATDSKILLPTFSPSPGKKMVMSVWVKEDMTCACASYARNQVHIVFTGGGGSTLTLTPTGNIIEGWQRYERFFTIPADAETMTVSLEASTDSVNVFFDDLRIHPFNANMKSFVFHPGNLRLMAELDENNYATFYEYDDDGTLIRLKKETERGVKTIRETRSALLKE